MQLHRNRHSMRIKQFTWKYSDRIVSIQEIYLTNEGLEYMIRSNPFRVN